MKKILLGLSAFIMMFAASCEQQELTPNLGSEATVSFNVATPQIATKAYSYSDGTTATKLQYAVYNAEGNILRDLTKTDATIQGSTTVNLQLTTGNTYSVLFWAAAPNAPYTVNFEAKTMSVDYSAAVSNDEARDAFYKYYTFTVNGAQTETIELKRPFAQLNIGTNDYNASEKAGYVPTTSSVKVKNIYNTLNLIDGIATGEEEITFAANAIPEGEQFPVTGYEYLAMNYLLVNAEKEIVDIEFTYSDDNNDAKTRTVGSVPVQRNYRTNIYGSLLTSEVDINVEIKPDYEEPSYELYNVVVNGVSYDDFAVAAAKAMELGKPVEFIQNVTIDADNTITVPAGKKLTLNLNGYTLKGKSDQTGSNRNMFDVRGEMTVNGANTMTRAAAEGNGVIAIEHVGENMGWNSSTNVFNVTAGGVLNLANVNAINFGGSDMGFVAHLNNWGEVTLNVENSTLESNYVAVRVFNSGNDMNNVTIKKSTLKGGSYAFWVHNYTVADFGTQEKVDAHKALLNFDIFNGTNEFIGKTSTPIRFGFTDALYADENGAIEIKDAEGNVVEGLGMDMEGNYAVTAAEGIASLSALVAADGDNGFAGKTVKLLNDIDLKVAATASTLSTRTLPTTTKIGDSDAPIGSTGERDARGRLICNTFKGTFDGNGKTIKNLYQSGWDFGYEWGQYGSIGLFAELENATVKNLTIESMTAQVEGGDISFIAGSATGTCVFENITIKNSQIGTYNNGCGGIIGWSGAGNYTFKDITLESDVVLGGLWGSFDSSIGGIVGQAEPGATYNFENVTINCRIDAYNDCTASYDYYNYRMCGMVVGRCQETTTIDCRNYPDLSKYNFSFNNVVVNYGDWMNYHYCEPTPGLNGGRGMRVEPGFAYDGLPEDFDHTQCVDNHMNLIPFDQLIGGDQYGVSGLREVAGVTVNYPASYRREVSSAAALKEALGKGVSVILDTDIDFGTTQLAITGENQVVDLGGNTLTTQMAYGGIALKNGASIVNGTIEHTSTVAAIKAFNVGSIENVTIKSTCATPGKTVTAIAVQQGGYVGTIKNVTIEGVSQGIEVGYQATVDLIEDVTVEEHTNGTANGIGLVINGGKVGLAKNSTFKGDAYGVTMHLKGVFAVGLELENCTVEGTTASIYAWDEKGISNTSGSLVLTYDANTTLTGPFVWDFEDECKSVVTLNKPE